MKKYILLFTLFFLNTSFSFAVEKIYLQEQTPNNLLRQYGYNYRNNPYYSSYRYKKTNYNNIKRIQRINRLRNLNRLKNNFLSWNLNRNNQGSLTGYSMPINSDIFTQMKIDPWENKYNHKSPNCTTELFSTPTTTNTFYRNSGEKILNDGGISSKAGVTIIYD